MSNSPAAEWPLAKINAIKALAKQVDKALANGKFFVPTKFLSSANDTKPLFHEKLRSKDYPDVVKSVNAWLHTNCQGACEQKQWPCKAGAVFVTDDRGQDGVRLWITKAWNDTIRQQRETLEGVLFSAAVVQSQQPGWCWGPLPLRGTSKVGFKISTSALQELGDQIAWDEKYFPKNPVFLHHYLKMHLRHALMKNQVLYSRSLAWFGAELEGGDHDYKPYTILFNTNLLSKYDRKVNLLVMCVPNKFETENQQKPWFAVRMVLSSELACTHAMRNHLRWSLQPDHSVDNLADASLVLIDEECRVVVPSVMRVPKEYLFFDPEAWPERVNYNGFVEHMRDAQRSDRIPREFVHLSDDDLRSRAEWAVQRAWESPNIVLSQWFCDKNSEQAVPQLILPLTLAPPPALEPRLGLVLEVNINNGIVYYNVLTALPLYMVFSNVLVCQPRGGHRLTANLPDVAPALMPENERMLAEAD